MIEQRQNKSAIILHSDGRFSQALSLLKYPACEFYHFTMPNAETPQYKINVHKLANQSAKMILTKEPHFP